LWREVNEIEVALFCDGSIYFTGLSHRICIRKAALDLRAQASALDRTRPDASEQARYPTEWVKKASSILIRQSTFWESSPAVVNNEFTPDTANFPLHMSPEYRKGE
jgi:hypothetical protein